MKKFLIIALMALSQSAYAQFFTGLAFDVNWANDGRHTEKSGDQKLNNSYGGTISPQFGYQFNDKLMAGARVNFVFNKSYFTEEDEKTLKTEKYVSSSIGWDIAPFCRYKILELGQDNWFSVWADVHGYFGRMYPKSVEEKGYIYKDFNKKLVYGIQAMPAVGIRLNEKSTIFINIAIISLAYAGSCTETNEGSEYTNKILLFTGKISGTFQAMQTDGLYAFKFGIVRKF